MCFKFQISIIHCLYIKKPLILYISLIAYKLTKSLTSYRSLLVDSVKFSHTGKYNICKNRVFFLPSKFAYLSLPFLVLQYQLGFLVQMMRGDIISQFPILGENSKYSTIKYDVCHWVCLCLCVVKQIKLNKCLSILNLLSF